MTKTTTAIILICCCISRAQAADIRATEARIIARVPEQKFVIFKTSGMTWEQKKKIVTDGGGRPIRDIALINAVVARFPAGVAPSLQAHPQVFDILDDGIAYMHGYEDNAAIWDGRASAKATAPALMLGTKPQTPKQRVSPRSQPITTVQQTPWNVERVNAPSVWRRSRGKGVKVCIVDSGVDTDHPDLMANVASGKNFVTDSQGHNDTEFDDELGHGSHVSGIIAAIDDDLGIVGVAPGASIYAARVFGKTGSTSWSTIVAALDWCVERRTQVINMSLGSSKENKALGLAIANAYKAGLVVVASAGNSSGGPVGFPAAYPQALAISSSDRFNKLSDFSSVGPEVDLIAPGSGDAKATTGSGRGILSTMFGGGYVEMRGTSMSAPHVTGTVALLLGAAPNLSNEAVGSILRQSATNVGLSASEQGSGLINILAAVDSLGGS